MIVSGLDLSLASTGLARVDLELAPHSVALRRLRGVLPKIPAESKRPMAHNLARLDRISTEILAWCEGSDVVAVEGPSFGSARPGQARGHWERGGLWWHIRLELFRRGVPVAQIPPANAKIYATGNGRADKAEMMIHLIRRCPWAEITGEDTADALALLLMTCHHLGQPLVQLPKTHTRGLTGVAWPEPSEGRQAMLGEPVPEGQQSVLRLG